MRIDEFFEELGKKRCIDEVIKAHPEIGEAEVSKFFSQLLSLLRSDREDKEGFYEVYIDGASLSNPGSAGIGVVVKRGGRVLKEISKPIGINTNNVAEYTALIEGLKTLKDMGVGSARVFSDSELVVKQIKGDYAVKNPKLKQLCIEALKLLDEFDRIELVHVEREKNKAADRLAKRAAEAGRNRN